MRRTQKGSHIRQRFLTQDTLEERGFGARVVARMSGEALKRNFKAIQELVPNHSILPMVKANAYGHGDLWACRTLLHMPGLYGFGVATIEEGIRLREELGLRARRARIVVFSGMVPWSEEKGQICEQYGLTAVIASDGDWARFVRGGWPERISYELKFNTGMNRLGMSPNLAGRIERDLRNRPSSWHPDGIMTHLSAGDKPDARLSLQQRERFTAIRSALAGAFPAAHFHFANSAAIWNRKHWDLDGLSDVVRPGLSLYGVPPWPGAPARGIKPVMTLQANVIAVHRLKRGECIGYAATPAVEGKEQEVLVAILAAGYADGIKRFFSHQGHAWITRKDGTGGAEGRFLGVVSMDLSAVRCPPHTQVGDWAELIGPHLEHWAQAKTAGTIPYELLTSVSTRVQRIYD